MDELKLVFPDLPYAVEEAMNRLRINVKFLFIEQYNTQGATVTVVPFYISEPQGSFLCGLRCQPNGNLIGKSVA